MPECCLWEPGELSQLWDPPFIVLGSLCVGRKKTREPLFPCLLVPFIKFTLPWPESVPSTNHVSATRPAHCHSWPCCPRCEGIPAQDASPGGPHPTAPAPNWWLFFCISRNSCHAGSAFSWRACCLWASPAGSALFLLFFLSSFLLCCSSLPSLYIFPTPFLKISPSLLLVGASELILLFFSALFF